MTNPTPKAPVGSSSYSVHEKRLQLSLSCSLFAIPTGFNASKKRTISIEPPPNLMPSTRRQINECEANGSSRVEKTEC